VTRSRSGFRPVQRSQRRKTAWSDGTGGTGITSSTQTEAVFVGAALTATQEGATIARMRGYFKAILTAGVSVVDGFSGAFGIGIASLAAVTAGIGSVPTPLTEQSSENWLYWHAFSVHLVTATIGDGANATSVVFERNIDTKAMRKFPTDVALYAAIEVVETGNSTLRFLHDSRALILLP